MKRIIITVLAIILCITSLSSCNSVMSSRVIDNVSQRKIDRNAHVAEWLAEDKLNSYDGISNHLFVYKQLLPSDTRNIYKVVVLRENVEKMANVTLEFVETETDITVKIIFTDKNTPAKDGRTVTYVEFKAPFDKMVYYDVVCEGESRELLQYTDINIAM